MITPSQADQIADRIANHLESVIDRACPVPAVDCRECRGRGFWSRDGDLVFCQRCEAGRARRARMGMLNRMVHGSYALAKRREKDDRGF
jgi:hypothetical protein